MKIKVSQRAQKSQIIFKEHPEWVSEVNPERGDYDTLAVSRNILSGSAKLITLC